MAKLLLEILVACRMSDASGSRRRVKVPARKRRRSPTPPLIRYVRDILPTANERERLAVLRPKPFQPMSYIDWAVLETLNLRAQVETLLRRGRWYELFEIRDEAFPSLTLEVLSTFEFKGKHHLPTVPATVSFRVNGQPVHLSYDDVARHLNVYSLHYRTQLGLRKCTIDWPHDLDRDRFWHRIIPARNVIARARPRPQPSDSQNIGTFIGFYHRLSMRGGIVPAS